jgi:glycosyltransferase involved in cell wall biosynthesis
MNLFEEIATLLSMFRLYRSLRPDIVHHITAKAILYGGLAARLARIPSSVAAFPGLGHYFIDHSLPARAVRSLLVRGYSFSLGHANSWAIVQNSDDARTLLNFGVTREGRTTITRGSGVQLDTFNEAPLSEEPPLVVLPGRLIWEKGIEAFVEVARRLKRSDIKVRFALVGNTHPSNPRAVPEAMLQAWHDAGIVEWWGRREDMPAVFAAATVICLPSTYGEGIPKALMEAAASGRAIVTYDVPGCREAVLHGVSGLLVPPGNLDALTYAIKTLTTNNVLCQRMGRAGRLLAEREFGVERVVEQTLAVYKSLLLSDERGHVKTEP